MVNILFYHGILYHYFFFLLVNMFVIIEIFKIVQIFYRLVNYGVVLLLVVVSLVVGSTTSVPMSRGYTVLDTKQQRRRLTARKKHT